MDAEQFAYEFHGISCAADLAKPNGTWNDTSWNVNAAIGDDGAMQPVGIVGIHQRKRAASWPPNETRSSIYVFDPAARRQHIAFNAMHGLLHIAFNELEIPKVQAVVAARNRASKALHRKLGYVPLGNADVEVPDDTPAEVTTDWVAYNPATPLWSQELSDMEVTVWNEVNKGIGAYERGRASVQIRALQNAKN